MISKSEEIASKMDPQILEALINYNSLIKSDRDELVRLCNKDKLTAEDAEFLKTFAAGMMGARLDICAHFHNFSKTFPSGAPAEDSYETVHCKEAVFTMCLYEAVLVSALARSGFTPKK